MRRPGGGRPSVTQKDPALLDALNALLEPATMGDPMRPLRWVSKSHAKLATALRALGHTISARTVGPLLERTGLPDLVRTHDFLDKELGKAIPYGVYDVGANTGWVTVGIDNDTSEFAVNSIRLWWGKMGRERYPNAQRLMITADGGGSNGSRVKLWKRELQTFADETGLSLVVCHYPPGASKWNKIEHRLFCHITQNWRDKPLTDRLAIVELIAATNTATGLTVRCELDEKKYPKGIQVTDEELASLNIERDEFHPEWNYTLRPRARAQDTKEAVIPA